MGKATYKSHWTDTGTGKFCSATMWQNAAFYTQSQIWIFSLCSMQETLFKHLCWNICYEQKTEFNCSFLQIYNIFYPNCVSSDKYSHMIYFLCVMYFPDLYIVTCTIKTRIHLEKTFSNLASQRFGAAKNVSIHFIYRS